MLTAVHCHRFDRELREIEPDAIRADDFVFDAVWTLCRNPLTGTQLGQSDVWFFPMRDLSDSPPLIIYYTFNKTNVHFMSIQISE